MKFIRTKALLLITIFIIGCSNSDKNQIAGNNTLPKIPEILNTPESRAEYLALHYWDNFNFNDTSLISKPEITEQMFVDFINILPYSPNYSDAINVMLDKSTVSPEMFAHIRELAEKYLYEPNSPMRNDGLYIPFLDYIMASDKIEPETKVRTKYQLEMALKNHPGTEATDLVYTLQNGKKGKLHDIKANYTILFFNDPDCEDCMRIKSYIMQSEILSSPQIAILAYYIDYDISAWRNAYYPDNMINGYDALQAVNKKGLYDVRAIPTLYLLDKEKQVIFKDTSIETIEEWLLQNRVGEN